MTSLYEIDARTIDGETTSLGEYAGKVLLIVNVASKCGFTPQYKRLEALYERYAGRGLVVLGFLCNQLGAQEPGAESEIAAFCSTTYDVNFPMFAEIEVNSDNTQPLYRLVSRVRSCLLPSHLTAT
jgi:glutathione peroxidase